MRPDGTRLNRRDRLQGSWDPLRPGARHVTPFRIPHHFRSFDACRGHLARLRHGVVRIDAAAVARRHAGLVAGILAAGRTAHVARCEACTLTTAGFFNTATDISRRFVRSGCRKKSGHGWPFGYSRPSETPPVQWRRTEPRSWTIAKLCRDAVALRLHPAQQLAHDALIQLFAEFGVFHASVDRGVVVHLDQHGAVLRLLDVDAIQTVADRR